jgi:hypothetical protein
MNLYLKVISALAGVTVLAGLAYHQGRVDQAIGEDGSMMVGTAMAASADTAPIKENSPARTLPECEDHEPGSEALAPDEERMIACGTDVEPPR